MPNNRNAEKAARQNEKRRLRNRAAKTSLRTAVRKARDAIASGEQTGTDEALKSAAKTLDQAASKKFIHRNKAARLKSRLSALAARKKNATAAK